MTQSSAQVIYYINSMIYLAMTYYGFVCIFKPAFKKRWILLAYMAFLIISSQQFFQFDSLWINLIFNTIAFASISLLFSGNLSTRLVFASVTYIMSILADTISFIGLSYLYFDQYGTPMPMEYLYSVQRTLTNIIYLPLFLANILVFRRFFIQKVRYTHYRIPTVYTFFVLFMMAGIILINVFYMVASINEIQTKAGQIIASQFIVLIVIFLVVWLYNTILNYLKAFQESRLQERVSERWEAQYKTAISSQKMIAEMKHNLRYHFMNLEGYLNEGNSKEAKEYLSKRLGEINRIINTGNISIDTIINYYRQQIKEVLYIDLDENLPIPPKMKLDGGYIVTILGNALENAIEACKNVEPSQRCIKINAILIPQEENSDLLITITNPYEIPPIADKKGNLKTTKLDKDNHGLGLVSILEMLPDDIGQIHFQYTNKVFIFRVLFYNVMEKNSNNLPNNTNDC